MENTTLYLRKRDLLSYEDQHQTEECFEQIKKISAEMIQRYIETKKEVEIELKKAKNQKMIDLYRVEEMLQKLRQLKLSILWLERQQQKQNSWIISSKTASHQKKKTKIKS